MLGLQYHLCIISLSLSNIYQKSSQTEKAKEIINNLDGMTIDEIKKLAEKIKLMLTYTNMMKNHMYTVCQMTLSN